MSDGQREPCCIQHADYPIGADACGATREINGKTHLCTRPDGHDGGHVSCNGTDDDGDHDHAKVWF